MSVSTGNKIKKIREFRNFTQEHMAKKLKISQNTYSKIETGQTKLNTDRLKEISEVLDVPTDVILNDELQTFNFNNSPIERFYGYIENLQEENRDLTQSLKDELANKQKEIDRLLTLLESKSK